MITKINVQNNNSNNYWLNKEEQKHFYDEYINRFVVGSTDFHEFYKKFRKKGFSGIHTSSPNKYQRLNKYYHKTKKKLMITQVRKGVKRSD